MLHPGFVPDVMSLSPAKPFEYSIGFRKPRGDLPKEIRKSFSRLMILAKVFERRKEGCELRESEGERDGTHRGGSTCSRYGSNLPAEGD